MESGLYITFFNKDEPHDSELPPVGPLDRMVLRHRQLVAERSAVHQADELGIAIDRWLEAELELQRATGEEPGGAKRSEMRVNARDGVFLRFTVFGDARERDAVPELGPFAVVTVGPHGVDADGQMLATRAASELAPWELTSGAGTAAGLHKPDIAFRTASGRYHASIAQAPLTAAAVEPAFAPQPRTETVFTPPPRSEPVFKPATEPEPLFRPREEKRTNAPAPAPRPPLAAEPAALTASDLELIQRIERERAEETLRARVQGEERRRLGVDEAAADEDAATTWAMRYRPQAATGEGAQGDVAPGGGFSIGGLLWRMRFAIIGLLLVGAGIYGFIAIRTGTAPTVAGAQQYTFVGVGSKFSGARFDWVINGVQRVNEAGNVRARGVFYVVRVGATNKGADAAQLAPNDFTLIDANGVEHAASGLGSGVYQSPENPGSPNIWPSSFAAGKALTFNVVFDIDPSLPRGMTFGIADTPRTRVRLD
jgi:hypothetical protein